MAAYIPLDVIVKHILVRLPERSLVFCRCVCKEWLHIVSGSDFRRIHLHHQTTNNRHQKRFICGPLKYRYRMDYCCLISVEHKKTVSACGGVFYSLDLESPSPTLYRLPGFQVHNINNYRLVQTLGYVNGMICMEACNTTSTRWPRIFFGNPLTGFYKILPEPLVNNPFIVGFGYDSSTDDFKFVRVDKITRHPHIYSLKKNSWTTNLQASDEHKIVLEWPSGWQTYMSVGTFADSSVYWFSNQSQRLIGFDLKDEVFTEVPVPYCGYGFKTLKVFQGSLCMISTVGHSHDQINVDMWLMKKESNKYSWIELIKIRNLIAKYIYPLAYMNGGVLCFMEHDLELCKGLSLKSQYALVDPQTSTIQDFDILGIDNGLLSDFVFRSQYPGYIDTFNFA